MTIRASFIALCAALIVAASGICARADSSEITGSWAVWTGGNRTHFTTTWSDSTGNNTNSDERDVNAETLGIAQALASHGMHVRFTASHEAGDYIFEGWIADGKGGGTYTFTPNTAFFDNLRKRGFTIDSVSQEMSAANLDITLAYVDDILSTGVTPDYHRLMSFRALGIDSRYIRDLASVGFSHMDAHEYVTFKAMKIDSGYVKYLQARGLRNLTPREVIRCKAEQI